MRQEPSSDGLLARSFGMRVMSNAPWPNPAYDWHQFLGVLEGSLEVAVGGAKWRVSTNQGVWIPQGQRHTLRAEKPSDIRVVYLRIDLFEDCTVLAISSLLRELLLKISLKGALHPQLEIDRGLYFLSVDEILHAPSIALRLPWPTREDIQPLARQLASGCYGPTIEEVARRAGLSRRTLERRFVSEVGIGIAQWRREWRLIEGARRVMEGDRVSDVALEMGYSGSSSFIESFRRRFGASPGTFRSQLLGG